MSALGLCLEATSALELHSEHTFTIEVGEARGVTAGEIRWCERTDVQDAESEEAQSTFRSGVALRDPVVLL